MKVKSRKAVLEFKDGAGDWSCFRIVTLLEDNVNTWKIRSWNPDDWFYRYVHKEALGERIKEL